MSSVRFSYLSIGTIFCVAGAAGIWGAEAALWCLPIVLLGLGIWGMVLATKRTQSKDKRRQREATRSWNTTVHTQR